MRSQSVAACLGVGLLTASSAPAFVINQLGAGSPNFQASAVCTGVTPGGTTLLTNGSVGYWPPSSSLSWVTEAYDYQFGSHTIHHGTDPDTEDTNRQVWTSDFGSSLSGTLSIYYYKAIDQENIQPHTGRSYPGYCFHGGDINASYVKGPNDPANLGWVQVCESSASFGGLAPGTPFVDPYPNDGHDDSPMYFNSDDNPEDFVHSVPAGADLIFGDTSSLPHPDILPFSGFFRANLFLVSWDDLTPHHLVFHDGIRWGYDGICTVPAPGAISIAALMGLIAARRRRRGAR